MEESIPKSKGKIYELKITPQIKKPTRRIPDNQNGCTKIWLDVHKLQEIHTNKAGNKRKMQSTTKNGKIK